VLWKNQSGKPFLIFSIHLTSFVFCCFVDIIKHTTKNPQWLALNLPINNKFIKQSISFQKEIMGQINEYNKPQIMLWFFIITCFPCKDGQRLLKFMLTF